MPLLLNTKRIRDQRDERDLSNKELAAALEISAGYLRNVLSGVNRPGGRLVRRIARVLGLTWDDIVEAENVAAKRESSTAPSPAAKAAA